MTLRKSFWGSVRENMKRRIGIIVCIVLFFMMSHPIATLLMLSNAQYDGWLTAAEKAERLHNALREVVGYNQGYAIAIMGIAIICAVQGFSYMYHKKKVDMYESLPITKSKRFAVIQVSGILSFAMIYLVNGIFSLIIGIGFNATTWETVQVFGLSFLIYLLLYISVYEFTTIAVMLTGNIIVALLAVGALGVYELGIQGLVSFFKGSCFSTYSYFSEIDMLSAIKLSPFFQLYTISQQNIRTIEAAKEFMQKGGAKILTLAILAIFYFLISFILYKIRPNEATERAIAFSKTKPVIKVLLMIPLSLLAGILFYEVSYNRIGFLFFGIILGACLTHAFFQVVFEYDFKAIFKNWKCFFYVIPAIAIFLAIFMLDIFGYDKYVPESNQVSSVAIVFDDGMNQTYYATSYDYYGSDRIRLETMNLTEENIDSVRAIAQTSIDTMNVKDEKGLASEDKIETENETATIMYATVLYKMKNGKEVYRSIPIDYVAQQDQINTIYGNDEYIGSCIMIDEEKIDSIEYANGVDRDSIENEKMDTIETAYLKDLKSATVADKCELPVGVISWSLKEEYYNYNRNLNLIQTTALIIYPSYKNTIAMLESMDIEVTAQLLAEEISYITITDNTETVYEENNFETITTGQKVETYKDQADIEKIIDAMVPMEFMQYVGWTNDYGDYYQIDLFVVPKKGIDRYQEIMGARFILKENVYPDL